MERQEKEAFVVSLKSALEGAGLVVITQQTGLTVDQSTTLRRKMREAGATFKIAKNTLARLAVQGTPFESLADYFTGPTGIAYSADPVAAAKIAVDFSKTNDKLDVVCGVMSGRLLKKDEIKALASLPSLDELRGKIIGLIQAPATKMAGVLQAPAGQLARVFSAYGKTGN